jgi:hypothetical protein
MLGVKRWSENSVARASAACVSERGALASLLSAANAASRMWSSVALAPATSASSGAAAVMG